MMEPETVFVLAIALESAFKLGATFPAAHDIPTLINCVRQPRLLVTFACLSRLPNATSYIML